MINRLNLLENSLSCLKLDYKIGVIFDEILLCPGTFCYSSLTASVCTGCAANSSPASAANPGRRAATTRLTLVTKMHAAACKATFVA